MEKLGAGDRPLPGFVGSFVKVSTLCICGEERIPRRTCAICDPSYTRAHFDLVKGHFGLRLFTNTRPALSRMRIGFGEP